MAFTETEKGTLAEILGIMPLTLSDHLDMVISELTTEVEDLIQADIVTWNLYRNDFTRIHPREKNFGAEVNPADVRATIRARVANWLSFSMPGAVSGQAVMYRG